MFKNWGIEQLNSKAYKKSIKDMKQADELIERICFQGLPNLQMLGLLSIGEETQEMIQCDTHFQQQQLPLMKRAIALCEQEQDYVSRTCWYLFLNMKKSIWIGWKRNNIK